ncbi:MAG: SRPBCC family protein [Flavisolibacter sp.]
MSKSIQHEYFYPEPPEAVWDFLTQPKLLEQWLMKNDFQLVLGHDFQFRTNPVPALQLDGIFYCKVLEILPLKKLSYSWKAGPGGGKITLDSLVTWTLEAKEAGTLLHLDHSGFKEADFTIFAGLDAGWLKNLGKIADRLKALKHGHSNA